MSSWEKDASGENDIHACTVSRRLIGRQPLPDYVIEAGGNYDLLVYVDGTLTRAVEMSFVQTFAHELRHVWQYFNEPIVFHSQTALSWVMPPQSTPCEVDAEKSAKRVLSNLYGESAVRKFLLSELAHCKPEHHEVTKQFAALDSTADPKLVTETIALLERHAPEIRKWQSEKKFVLQGIPEL